MAVVEIDGFDYYTAAMASLRGWSTPTAMSVTTGRFGVQQALRMNNPSPIQTTKLIPAAAGTTWSVGFAFRTNNTLGATARPLFAFEEGATRHVMIIPSTADDGSISAYRGTTLVTGSSTSTTAPGVLVANTWHWIDLVVVIHDTAGSVLLKVDGVEVLNLTTQDTRNAGTGLVDRVSVFAPSATTASQTRDYDDLIIRDDSTLVTDHRISTLYPSGNGNSSQFLGSDGNSTDNYLLVDEATHNSDTDYVESSTAGHIDLYAMEDLPTTAVSVLATAQRVVARKTDAGARTGRTVLRTGSTNYEGADIALTDSYAFHSMLRTVNPNTAAAWTNAGINGLETGVKVQT
jgi:hypothetical protein